MTAVTQADCTGKGCVNPTNSITWPVTLGTTRRTIYDAAANTGKGTVVLTPTYESPIPQTRSPGPIRPRVTLTGATGP